MGLITMLLGKHCSLALFSTFLSLVIFSSPSFKQDICRSENEGNRRHSYDESETMQHLFSQTHLQSPPSLQPNEIHRYGHNMLHVLQPPHLTSPNYQVSNIFSFPRKYYAILI